MLDEEVEPDLIHGTPPPRVQESVINSEAVEKISDEEIVTKIEGDNVTINNLTLKVSAMALGGLEQEETEAEKQQGELWASINPAKLPPPDPTDSCPCSVADSATMAEFGSTESLPSEPPKPPDRKTSGGVWIINSGRVLGSALRHQPSHPTTTEH